jgi:enamine deaminase RidA (YjgF/YER057c/UK114 family)
MLKPAVALAALLACATGAEAQEFPKKIPAPGGHVIIQSKGAQANYDAIGYAPARRAGDFLYVSGMIVGPGPNDARDIEGLKAQTRRFFTRMKAVLEADGLTLADVVMINSFHVWNGPGFKGTRDEQLQAIVAVKNEFMPPPHPAWTAVGTTGLLADDGVVEIQMIAYAPKK